MAHSAARLKVDAKGYILDLEPLPPSQRTSTDPNERGE
jgi:hypothetical protein